jgi:tetratricopeptide (TPR) repeat protein
LEKAIDIKRRAQRCIQNGDLDGALNEYEKLVGAPDSDPYNYVLLADLLYKKGDQGGAAERYLAAVHAYQSAALYKNAIAVCKKMVRLSLSPARVLESLAQLHALDGLASEASLYYVQYAEHLMRSHAPADAAAALRKAFDVCQENVRVLEQLSEAWLLAGDNTQAAQAMLEAASHYRAASAPLEAKRCEERAKKLDATATLPASMAAPAAPAAAAAPANGPSSAQFPEPGRIRLDEPAPSVAPQAPAAAAPAHERLGDLDTGRHVAEAPPAIPQAGGYGLPVLEASASQGHDGVPPQAPTVAHEVTASESTTAPASAPVYEIPAAASAPVWKVPSIESPEPKSPEAGQESTHETENEATHEPAREPALAEPEPIEAGHTVPAVEMVYEIPDDEPELEPTAAASAADEHGAPAGAGVYEIDPEPEAATATSDEAAAAPVAAGIVSETPEPVAAEIEALLTKAQTQFRSGDREQASVTLAHAARGCEQMGRIDHAASIYRSLGKGPHATPEVLELWLANCVRRNDGAEAGQVACELGDRALTADDAEAAKRWFKRALAFDADNEVALRRLHRLEQAPSEASAASLPEAAPEPVGEGRVEIAVGRAQAVSFDLAGLLAEFQRGVEEQLAGDAQSHYDLGMTYREMGLLDQAMSSFRCAQQDPMFAARALEMVGRCLSDQGRLADAESEFRRALTNPGVSTANDGELRYHLGLALAGQGRHADALLELERVQSQLPGFEDVDQHVADLRTMLGRAA